MIKFDHIEVHVKNSETYALFLKKLFKDGRYKRISDNNTYMFVSADDLHVEIKQREDYKVPFNLETGIGFCMPCLRMRGAYEHLIQINEIEISNQIENPDGACYFFRDYEGINWHFKDYDIQDVYINI